MTRTQKMQLACAGFSVLLAIWSIAIGTGTRDLARALMLLVTAVVLVIQASR